MIRWQRERVTTWEVAKHLRLTLATTTAWYAAAFGRFPRPWKECWTPDQVNELETEVTHNRLTYIPTSAVAKIFHVHHQTPIHTWTKYGFILPERKKVLIGMGRSGRSLMWAPEDVERARVFLAGFKNNVKRRLRAA